MQKLSLLFTKDALQWQLSKAKNVLEEEEHFLSEESFLNFIEEKLDEVLVKTSLEKIEVLSAFNHFTLTPEGFSEHDMGYLLISYNSPVDKEKEELMLSVNKKYGVQFYYSFPKYYYERIKALKVPSSFNFSGEKFLNTIQTKNQKEIHIHLFHHQVEFLALDHKKVILYNNIDATSEVDFLYFIMFTLKKIDFSIRDTHFYIYGELVENETFISELKKFVKHFNIVFQNQSKKNFILNR